MRIFLILSFLFNALVFGTIIAFSLNETAGSSIPSGTILINVYMSSDVVSGFKLMFPSAFFTQTYQEEIFDPQKGEDYPPRGAAFQHYLDTLVREREYIHSFDFKGKLEKMLAGYDLSEVKKLYYSLIRECDPNFVTTLKKKTRQSLERQDSNTFPLENFIPNRQLTYAVFNPHPYHYTPPTDDGLLIDLRTKEISYPFCGDRLGNFEWSPDGRYIAYACEDSKRTSNRVLVVKDVTNKNKTIFRRDIGRYIDDIAWEPEGQYIAVLNMSGRWGLMPWELLSLIAGHPVSYNTLYLEIFNLEGEQRSSYEIVRNEKYAWGRIVWTKE